MSQAEYGFDAARFRSARRKAGASVARIAHEAGVTERAVSLYLAGTRHSPARGAAPLGGRRGGRPGRPVHGGAGTAGAPAGVHRPQPRGDGRGPRHGRGDLPAGGGHGPTVAGRPPATTTGAWTATSPGRSGRHPRTASPRSGSPKPSATPGGRGPSCGPSGGGRGWSSSTRWSGRGSIGSGSGDTGPAARMRPGRPTPAGDRTRARPSSGTAPMGGNALCRPVFQAPKNRLFFVGASGRRSFSPVLKSRFL